MVKEFQVSTTGMIHNTLGLAGDPRMWIPPAHPCNQHESLLEDEGHHPPPAVQELQAKPIHRPLGEQWAPGCRDLHFNFSSCRAIGNIFGFFDFFNIFFFHRNLLTQSSSSAPCWSAPPPYWRTWPVWQVWIYIVVLFHLLIILLISGSAVTADKWAVSTPVWVKVKVKSCKI